MTALAALLGFLFLFGSVDSGPQCPSLRSEVVDIYEADPRATFKDGRWTMTFKTSSELMASTTYELLSGKPIIKVGTTTDLAAVEHNKQVREYKNNLITK